MTPEQSVILWAREVIGKPFVWGETDCAMVALEGLSRLTGEDYAGRYRGMWDSREAALTHYETELPSDALKSFGAEQVLGTFAVLGDVVTVPADPWPEQMHFVLGAKSLCSDESSGVRLIPTRVLTAIDGAAVWRVAKCLKPYRR